MPSNRAPALGFGRPASHARPWDCSNQCTTCPRLGGERLQLHYEICRRAHQKVPNIVQHGEPTLAKAHSTYCEPSLFPVCCSESFSLAKRNLSRRVPIGSFRRSILPADRGYPADQETFPKPCPVLRLSLAGTGSAGASPLHPLRISVFAKRQNRLD